MFSKLTIKDLIKYNQEGFIPGPHEDEESFLNRVECCKNIPQELLPFKDSEKASNDFLEPALKKTKDLLDISPQWVPLFFSNHRLLPWHGGCAWIAEKPSFAFLQLRQKFKKSQKIFGLYDRNELISHELAHAGRMAFDEPKFEEMLAYLTSSSFFHKKYGPLFQSSLESLAFIGILFLSLILSLLHGIFLILPLAALIFFLVRLFLRHRQFDRCHKNLSKLVNEEASYVIYRLSDNEIIDFSSLSANEIIEYAKKQTSLRWIMIQHAYTKLIEK